MFSRSNLDLCILILLPPTRPRNEAIFHSEIPNRVVKRAHQDAQ